MSSAPAAVEAPETLACAVDDGFAAWLHGSGGSLAISTYQAGRLFLVGWNGRQVSFLPRAFDRPMGLDVSTDGRRMALGTRHSLFLFGNSAPLAPNYLAPGRYDALYLPHVEYHLPDLQIHDLAYAGSELWMVNTRLSCLCVPSVDSTFEPRWRPRFIDDLAPEDRCHLNGLAVRDAQPAFVTALGASNTPQGWRDGKANGGVVIDIASGEIALNGLAMPHSPRWHDGALWLLNSGDGALLRMDTQGRAEVICRLPAYLRGLTFVGHHALVGLCQIRERKVFGGMPVAERHAELVCGVAIIDTRSGRQTGLMRYTQGCSEIYDLRFLPGVQRPNVLNLAKEDVKLAISAPDCWYWLPREELETGPGEQALSP
jgi:uncharacterized protein (TIGR03032 family)